MSLLEVEAINSFYGDSHILFDVSLRVEENEVVALLGRNGAGKTTTLRTIMGVLTPAAAASGWTASRSTVCRLTRSRDGHAACAGGTRDLRRPDGGGEPAPRRADRAECMEPGPRFMRRFPRLAERRRSGGRTLSGGEQQMLAIARALIRDARVILLDEPFEGLAPLIVRDLVRVSRELAQQGRTIVVVEQNVVAALSFADRVYVLNNGHVVWTGTPDELHADPAVMKSHLGV